MSAPTTKIPPGGDGGASGIGRLVVDTRTCSPPDSSNSADRTGVDRQHKNDKAFVFSTLERTHLLCKVELQREEAARIGRRGGGGGGRRRRRHEGEGATEIAFGVAVAAGAVTTSASAVAGMPSRRSSTTRGDAGGGGSDRISSNSSSSSSGSGSGSGSGRRHDFGKGDPAEGLSRASSACCAEGRLEVLVYYCFGRRLKRSFLSQKMVRTFCACRWALFSFIFFSSLPLIFGNSRSSASHFLSNSVFGYGFAILSDF